MFRGIAEAGSGAWRFREDLDDVFARMRPAIGSVSAALRKRLPIRLSPRAIREILRNDRCVDTKALVPGGGVEPPRAEAKRILSPFIMLVIY